MVHIYFKPKIPIWETFGGFSNGRYWYILWPFGLAYGHLVFLWLFGIFYGHMGTFFPHWYFVPRKIWQSCLTLIRGDDN
jgi:hypothetical protein